MLRFALIIAALLAPAPAFAHPGRTDSSGGHHDRKRGGYHYHGGARSASSPSPPAYATREAPSVKAEPRYGYRTTARTEARTFDRRTELAERYAPVNSISWEALAKAQREKELRLELEKQEQLRVEREKLEQERLEKEILDREKRERIAAEKFRLAKQLFESGKRDASKKWLLEIIAEYSETKAAEESRLVLERMGHSF